MRTLGGTYAISICSNESKAEGWELDRTSNTTFDLTCAHTISVLSQTCYDSWEEWTRHEQWAHQQRIWRCLEHPQHEYVELAAYEDHVRIYYAAVVHQLLSFELLKSQESV